MPRELLVGIDILIALISLIHITWIISKSKKNYFFYLFLVTHILVIVWIIGHLMETLALNVNFQKQGTWQVYLGLDFIAPFWTIFVINIAEYKYRKSKILIAALFLPSVLMFAFMWTDQFHHLYFVLNEYRAIQQTGIAIAFAATQYIMFYCSVYMLIKSPKVRLSRFDATAMAGLMILTIAFQLTFNFIPALSIYDVSLPIMAVTIILIIFIVNKYKFLPIRSVALQTVVDNISGIIIACDKNNKIDFVNKNFHFLFDYDYTKNNQLADFLSYICRYTPQEDHAVINGLIHFHDQPTIQNIKIILEREITFAVQVRNLKNQKGRSIGKVIMFQDMTDSQELAIEKERTRIAQEFHDTLGHTMTVIVTLMRLAKIELSKRDCQAAQSKVNEALSLSVEGIAEIRNIVNNLKTDRINLISQSIYTLIEKTNSLPLKTDLLVQGRETLMHQKYRDVIYLLCKESITNTLRHSDAQKMDIVIKFSESMIKVFIIDNGNGCKSLKKGNGLSNIEEKVIQSGGQIYYSQNQNIGFGITAEIPIRGDKDD
ncbi:MAG TPA: hypothetical protein DEQ30_05920 [Porphyromonadaceae bacterium]|nr:hypothetical protein [Porphyromonadaceae bacterium]